MPAQRDNWEGRALCLFFKLNQQMILYTPLSFRARRASRIIQRLVAAMEERS